MENLTAEQLQQVVNHALTLTDIAFYIFLAFLTFIGICCLIKMSKQDKYVQTLNDHDSQVIAKYTHIKIFERKKQNAKQTEENTTSKQN